MVLLAGKGYRVAISTMLETNEIILATLRKLEEKQASMEKKMQDSFASLDRDLAIDRQGIQDNNIQGKKTEAGLVTFKKEIGAEITELRKSINLTANRTRDKVAEAVQPLIDSTDNLESRIKKSKKVFIKEKLNWLQRLFGGFKDELKREVKNK